MDYEYTRQKLHALFDQTGISQKDFAHMCGLNQSTVTRLLNGKRSPQLVTIVRMCQTFGVKPSFFVRELRDETWVNHPASSDGPVLSNTPLTRALLEELQSLEEEELQHLLHYVRFRRGEERRKKA